MARTLWILLVVISASCSAAQHQPNILFIFTDDHATQAISAYGSQINNTPNIDRLAREGMIFNRCYVTNSICAPSRAVIQTGKYSHLNGVHTNQQDFDGTQQTFPKLLQQHGYQTALVGKWHLKSTPTGFDYAEVLPGQGLYYNPIFLKDGVRVQHPGYVTDITTDLALDWLKQKRNPTVPFMLMVQHKAPHRPWEPGPDKLTMYADETIPEPSNLLDDFDTRSSALHRQELSIKDILDDRDLKIKFPNNLTPDQRALWEAAYARIIAEYKSGSLQDTELVQWKYQQYIKDYLRCIASVDDNTGRLLDWLDESGLSENTIVIYSSDQGFFLGEHGLIDKRFMYEESLRTPLIVRWPGHTKPGSVNGALVSNLDFAQTFLDIAGIAQPADMQGQSLIPLMQGNTPNNWRESHYYQFYEEGWGVPRHEGVTNGRYKLISYYDLNEWELFDLANDPQEMNNVCHQQDYQTVMKELQAEMVRLKLNYAVPPSLTLEAQREAFK